MSYFIFRKNSEDIENTCYKIAENEFDLNNLNLIKEDYKIIEDNLSNFILVKHNSKLPLKYNGENIIYKDVYNFFDKENLENYINGYKNQIEFFLKSNPDHILFNRWNDYYNQLNNTNLNTISYKTNPKNLKNIYCLLDVSLEKYFYEMGLPSYHYLQIP